VANTREGNVGGHTLSQDLGPLHRLQRVVVWTDNVTLKYFATQPKLSSKHVRWQDILALFNVDIRYKPGKEYIVPDALSRKHQLRVVYVGESELQKEVRLASRRDAFAKEVRQSI
jgi:hypothetical protein